MRKGKDYIPLYWNNKGKYEKLYHELFSVLVPSEGESPSDLGEMLRITSRIYYDIYNNGGWNMGNMKDWRIKLVRLCPPSMKDAAKRFIRIPKKLETSNTNYQKFLDCFVDWVVNYVQSQLFLRELEKRTNE